MKKLRLLIVISILMCATLMLAACYGPALPQPANLKVDDAVTFLYWDSVAGARGYIVEIDGEEKEVRRTSYNISTLDTGVNHKFRVKAVGDRVNYSNSSWSEPLTVYKPFENGMKFNAINGNTEYEVSNIGTAATTTTEVEIPDMYRGKPVTKIGKTAFYNGTKLTKITIPDTIKEIGESAFRNCSSLKEIVIPDSVTVINRAAFQGCGSLKTVTLPKNLVELPENMFYGCHALETVNFGDKVEVIGDNAFWNCRTIETIILPDSVLEIGASALSSCDSLRVLKLGKNVQTIGTEAIRESASLEEVDLGDSLVTMGDSVFYDCPSLVSVTMPNTVTSIGEYVFYGCTKLEEVDLSSSLVAMGRNCFNGTVYWENAQENDLVYVDKWLVGSKITRPQELVNAGAQYVTIENDTIGIASYAFHVVVRSTGEDGGMVGNALRAIDIPASVKYLCESAFEDCINLTRVTIGTPDEGSNIKDIGNNAFYRCNYLDTFEIYGETLETIGNYAFAYCNNLGMTSNAGGDDIKEIDFPSSLKSIGTYAFAYTHFYDYYSGVVYVGGWVVDFKSTDATSAQIDEYVGFAPTNGQPDTRKRTVGIANYSFFKCENLATVTIPSSIKYIGRAAFYKCPLLSSVTIPEGVETISDYAFYKCESMTNINLPSTIRNVGNYAFYNVGAAAENFTTYTNTDKIETIGQSAFYSNGLLTDFEFGANLKSIGMRAFFGTSLTQVTLSDVLVDIPNYAFANCQFLSSVEIGENVETIGKYAFSNCSSLTEISIPESVVSIGDYAFRNNTSLESVTLAEGLESIGKSAFVNCEKITSLRLPATLKFVDNMAFRNCTGLTSAIIKENIETTGMHLFYGTQVTLYTDMSSVPEGWHARWNSSYRPVIFGCEMAKDANGVEYVVSFVKNSDTLANALETNEIMAPIRDGYTFAGWATSANSDRIAYEAYEVEQAIDGTTLYAVWE